MASSKLTRTSFFTSFTNLALLTLLTSSCFRNTRHIFCQPMSTTRLATYTVPTSRRLLLSSRNSSSPKCLIQLRNSSTSSQDIPTPPRPYRFHIGVSWAGKQINPRERHPRTTPFPRDSEIGSWRDHCLQRQANSLPGPHIGEDFFYVQHVSVSSFLTALRKYLF